MNHSHHHTHAHHDHGHAPTDFGRAFAIGIALNGAFVLAEAGAGLATGSMALLADAGHNLSDVLGLVLAWAGAALAARPASARFTYGLGGSTILAALANALLLMGALGAIMLGALQRLWIPSPVPGGVVMAVAGVGILVNGVTAWLFAKGRAHDLNVRGAYLHMAADAVVSAGVVAAGLAILLTGAAWIDAATSLIVAAFVAWSSWGLLRESLTMALGGVPAGIEPEAVKAALAGLPGVAAVHDLHIWPLSTTRPVMTAHLLMPGGHPGDAFLSDAQALMRDRFGIGHATIQIELGAAAACEAEC